MRINSRQKGKRGERQWRDVLRANGYEARRGQQFSGSAESPDVVCPSLPWAHFEVKAVENLNIEKAFLQARADAGKLMVESRGVEESEKGLGVKVPIVAHRRNHSPWLVTMDAEWFGGAADGLLSGGCFFAQHSGRRLNLRDAMESTVREANGRAAFVIHGRKGLRLVTMQAETFFKLLRGQIEGISKGLMADS